MPLTASAQQDPNLPLLGANSPVYNQNGERVGTLTNIVIEQLRFRTTDAGRLVVSGVLDGTLVRPGQPNRQINDLAFSNIGAKAATDQVCQILTLDIGRINLNLLGLVVNLSPVRLDITAVAGPGNLLGNLLCALVGLLD